MLCFGVGLFFEESGLKDVLFLFFFFFFLAQVEMTAGLASYKKVLGALERHVLVLQLENMVKAGLSIKT